MKLAKFVKFREEKFGGVLFETRSEKVFALNPTAAAVVRAIEHGGEDDIVGQLMKDFNDHDDAVAGEAAAFIVQLKERGLVEE